MIVDSRPELTDHVIALYCDWRMRCEEVRTTYRRLDGAPKAERPLAFAAFWPPSIARDRRRTHTRTRSAACPQPPECTAHPRCKATGGLTGESPDASEPARWHLDPSAVP